jgi:hypothetical protein
MQIEISMSTLGPKEKQHNALIFFKGWSARHLSLREIGLLYSNPGAQIKSQKKS